MLHPEYEIVLEVDDPASPPFQKAASLNRAFRRSAGDVVIQADAEVFADPEQVAQLVSRAQEHGWSLFERVIKMGQSSSDQVVLQSPGQARYDISVEDAENRVDCRRTGTWWGYLVAVRRDKWIDLDERFTGWGYEDVAWRHAMATLVGPPGWVDGDLYHIWHPKTAQEMSGHSGQLKTNHSLYLHYARRKGKPDMMRKLVEKGRSQGLRHAPGMAKRQREQMIRYLAWVAEEGGSEGPTHLDTLFQPQQQERLRWLKSNCVGTVMELGCCYGYVLAYVGGDIGIDWNPHSIQLAQVLNPRKEFRCEDVRKLSAADQSIDTVILPDVLEHLPWDDIPLALREARRVARRRVLVTLPGPDSSYAQSPKHQWIATADRVQQITAWLDGEVQEAGEFVMISWRAQTAITLYANRTNYVDHLQPIYQALDGRATFVASDRNIQEYCRSRGIDATLLRRDGGGTLVVATPHSDISLRGLGHNKTLVLLNHGAGQSWIGNPNSSYAGGPHRAHFSLILEPGEHPAEKDRESCPDSRVVAIGCPKLDKWHGYRKSQDGRVVIAVGFHQANHVVAETPGCFDYYKPALPGLAEWCRRQGYQMLGVGHPVHWDKMSRYWRSIGVVPIADWDSVMDLATLYVRDQMSTIYEFASLDKPVVVLNAPFYRRDVEHGLRFWECADVGVNCDGPDGLIPAIEAGLADPPEQQEKRRRAVAKVYAHLDGKATERAVTEILRVGAR